MTTDRDALQEAARGYIDNAPAASLEGYWEKAYWDIVPKLLTALAPEPPALDVERLAEAMVLAFRAEAKERWPFLKGDGWPAYEENGQPAQVLLYKQMGQRVAAEYARLAAEGEGS